MRFDASGAQLRPATPRKISLPVQRTERSSRRSHPSRQVIWREISTAAWMTGAVTASSRVVSAVAAGGVSKSRIVSPIQHYQLAAESSHDSPRTGCSPFPIPRRWALALRRHASFEATSRDTRSSQQAGHALPEGTARATQLAPSAVTASAVGGSANRSVVG